MKNLPLIALYLLAGCVLPLAPKSPDLLAHYKVIILMAACIVMLGWANPAVRFEESRQKNSDRSTLFLIFVLGYIAWVAPIAEWAYFHEDAGFTAWTVVGLSAIIIGLWFRIWSLHVLGRYFTGVVQQVEGHQLVTNGPYSVLRHPSYLGSIVAILGCSVLLEAWIGAGIAMTAMMAAYYFRIRAEERLLISIFGDAYLDYQRQTWRLAPFIW